MVKLTKQYIEDHLAGMHTEESWARSVIETVLKAAITKLGDQPANEVTIDTQFRVSPVERDGPTLRTLCMRVCVVVAPTGHEVCFHKEMPK